MHAKFEVNSCCSWDFRQGGGDSKILYHHSTILRQMKQDSKVLKGIAKKFMVEKYFSCLDGNRKTFSID